MINNIIIITVAEDSYEEPDKEVESEYRKTTLQIKSCNGRILNKWKLVLTEAWNNTHEEIKREMGKRCLLLY